MKNIGLLAGILILLFTSHVTIAQKPFTVDVLPSTTILKDYSSYYLEISSNDSYYKDTGVQVADKIRFDGAVTEPAVAKLILISTEATGTKKSQTLNLIVEPEANIIVDMTMGIEKPEFSGSATQSDYTRYMSAVAPLQAALSKQIDLYRNEKDSTKQKQLEVLYKTLSDSARKVNVSFFKNNPCSYVTALLFKNLVNMVWDNAPQANEIYQLLPQPQKDLSSVQAFYKKLQVALELSVGKTFPDFELPDMTGKKVKVSSYRGKYLFIDFWASWCAPCRAEAPHLIESYNRYKKKGYDILGVSFDEAIGPWVSAVKKDKYTWTNLLDITGMGMNSYLSNKMGIKAIPRNFLIDPNGIIIATNLRGKDLLKKLQTIF
jgi:peroxiredoxin